MKEPKQEPIFFDNRIALKKWFTKNHSICDSQWVGLHKKAGENGKAQARWPVGKNLT